ncbi:MAG TPA: HEPN domain-containing protein [Candidatus Nanoarchaeia archaeon]|nr:HEPN domain-containing protein [Candidatus Nanoarchaeia archaeon]
MSQASKHVEWCLNKAKKEIEECTKLGKRAKHRGLLRSNPNLEEAKKHLAKAEHNLEGITTFREVGFSDWSMSAGFYCIYHCFLAIAAKFGYESSNQTCTIALMRFFNENNTIKLDEKFIKLLNYEEMRENSIIDLREDYTYGVQISVKDEAKINDIKKTCKELVDITKEIIFK